MKHLIVDTLRLPLPILLSHECENCGYEFIILTHAVNEVHHWTSAADVSYCPRCGAVRGKKVSQQQMK